MWMVCIRLLVLVLCILVCLSGCAVPTQGTVCSNTVLIDAGHGGDDGGAVASDGTIEKHINLEISLILRDIMRVCGVNTIMTREEDISLHDNGADSIREKKVSDMRNRLTMYNQADAVISIHQNHFDQSKYCGTQVFYSANHKDSKRLAEAIKHAVTDSLQPDNHRELKMATNGIYLLHHTKAVCVLVECGFLSNPSERELLKDNTYRQQFSIAVTMGYLNYFSEK